MKIVGKHRARVLELDRLARRLKMIEVGAYQMEDNPNEWWGVCMKCQQGKPLQWAHIISRRIHATRWDPDNAVAICAGCHYAAHQHPLDFAAWVKERLGEERYYQLVQRSRNKGIDYGAEKARLEQELRRYA